MHFCTVLSVYNSRSQIYIDITVRTLLVDNSSYPNTCPTRIKNYNLKCSLVHERYRLFTEFHYFTGEHAEHYFPTKGRLRSNVTLCFIVSGSETSYIFRVLLTALQLHWSRQFEVQFYVVACLSCISRKMLLFV